MAIPEKSEKDSPLSETITDEKLSKYFDITGKAIEKVKLAEAKYVKIHFQKAAEDFFDMAKRYFEDAKHFADKGDKVNAFACLNYAHGWLDAGARLGLFDVDGDNQLFTVDKESGLKVFKVDEENEDYEIEGQEDYDLSKPGESEDDDPHGLRD